MCAIWFNVHVESTYSLHCTLYNIHVQYIHVRGTTLQGVLLHVTVVHEFK